MKKIRGFSAIGAVIVVVIAGLLIFATTMIFNNSEKSVDRYSVYIEASEENGEIADHVKGDKNAPVLIFEYADFQCPGCASMNPYVNKAVAELNGKLAVVYRSMLLSYHQNATAAASSAEAAGLQGYWKEYGDKLFSSQSEWEYADASERSELFEKYFVEVTGGKGDVEQFKTDLVSARVSKKISADMNISKKIDVQGTPAFYIDGQLITWGAKDGGKVIVNGKTISWDSARSGSAFVELLKEIVEAKLSDNN